MILIAAVFGLLAFLPSPKQFKTQHLILLLLTLAAAGAFITAIGLEATHMADKYAPWLHNIEETGPQ